MADNIKFLFDLDGTVTACETLPLVARHFGLGDRLDILTEAAVAGNDDFAANFSHRVDILAHNPTDEIANVISHVPLNRLISKFITTHPTQCAIVTSNIRSWCQLLTDKLGCALHASEYPPLCILDKAAVVQAYRADGHTTVFVGDGHNDIPAMQAADIAIALDFKGSLNSNVRKSANYTANNTIQLIEFLKTLF